MNPERTPGLTPCRGVTYCDVDDDVDDEGAGPEDPPDDEAGPEDPPDDDAPEPPVTAPPRLLVVVELP
jgi:hypothetical protein